MTINEGVKCGSFVLALSLLP